MVETFVEHGAQARVWTMRVDVQRQPAPADTWLIANQERLTSIDGLYRLALDPDTQLDATGLVVSSEDVQLTMTRGSVFVAKAGSGITALVLLGNGVLPFGTDSDFLAGINTIEIKDVGSTKVSVPEEAQMKLS